MSPALASRLVASALLVMLIACVPPAPTFTITYDANGGAGTVPTDTNAYPAGATATVAGPGGLDRSGFTFAGWNTEANGAGVLYPVGSSIPIGTSNVTLYATWVASESTFSVTYDANGGAGSVPADSNAYPSGASATVAGPGGLDRSGFTFAGWNTEPNGAGSQHMPGGTLTIGTSNITLYATWVAANESTFTISYEANGGAGSVPADTNAYPAGATATVAGPGGLDRSGFTFAGWNTEPNGAGSQHMPGGTLTIGASNVTLYATWVANESTFSITYDANGGAGSVPADTNAYPTGGTATVAGPGGLDRSGFTFAGWNTEPNGAGSQYMPGGTLTIGTSNVTLYATWRIQATIATGHSHTAAVLSDGRLYTWGNNTYGQLGDGTNTNANAPTLVPDFPPTGTTITTITTGHSHTAALLGNGRLYIWGRNIQGQLGDGTNTNANVPTLVPGFPPTGATITTIATGGSHTAALLSDGTLYTWGNNTYGQLGDGTTSPRNTPTLVPGFPPTGATITTIAAGLSHTAALLSDGRLYSWGDNAFGRLGDGTTSPRNTPTLVPNFPPTPVVVAVAPVFGATITSIATGGFHTAALLSDSRLYTWGLNTFGQLGDGTTTYDSTPTPTLVPGFPPTGATITTIATGEVHTYALLRDGRLYTWGWNAYGQLGDGTTTNKSTPTLVPGFPPTGATISTIATGLNQTAALLSDGRLYTWGWNAYGQLGDGTTTNKSTPTLVPDFPPLASP